MVSAAIEEMAPLLDSQEREKYWLATTRGIRRRQWWLWASAIAVTLGLTLGMISFSLNGQDWLYPIRLRDSIRGLIALVLLFYLYTIYMQVQIHRMHKRLSERDDLFRLITENVMDLVAVVDTRWRWLYNSPSYEKVFGYSSEELAATPVLERVHPDDRAALIDAGNALQQTGAGRRLEYRFRHKDGTWRILESSNSALRNSRGEVDRFIGVNRDVTELRNHEMQLRQAQKMEAVGRLSGGIAHDFNNVLSVIIAYSEMAEDSLGPGANLPELRRGMQQIRKAGERAASLTRQLLAFSRKQVLQPKVIAMNSVVANIEDMLRRLIGAHIQLTTDLDPELGHVCADESQIEQVIMNLAVNARDAMPDGGRLVIRTGTRILEKNTWQPGFAVKAGTYVVLSVTDTGKGMSAETQAHIFEPFFTTKEKGKGTGLGLATVYGIVKQSGGYIAVHSEPGKGSKFEAFLPQVGKGMQPHAQRTDAERCARGSETILLVEEDAAVRAATLMRLQGNGYTVLEAASGNQAIEMAQRLRGPIHLLLCGMTMPGMNGRATAKRITSIHPGIRVVYTSGYAAFADEPLGEEEMVLEKPFTRDALLAKVHEAFLPRQSGTVTVR